MVVGDSNLETAYVGDPIINTSVEHRNLEKGDRQNDSANKITRDDMHVVEISFFERAVGKS